MPTEKTTATLASKPKPKRNHVVRLVNRKHLRELILTCAQQERAHEYDRVAASVFDEAEGVLRHWVLRKVRSQPSKGKTIL